MKKRMGIDAEQSQFDSLELRIQQAEIIPIEDLTLDSDPRKRNLTPLAIIEKGIPFSIVELDTLNDEELSRLSVLFMKRVSEVASRMRTKISNRSISEFKNPAESPLQHEMAHIHKMEEYTTVESQYNDVCFGLVYNEQQRRLLPVALTNALRLKTKLSPLQETIVSLAPLYPSGLDYASAIDSLTRNRIVNKREVSIVLEIAKSKPQTSSNRFFIETLIAGGLHKGKEFHSFLIAE